MLLRLAVTSSIIALLASCDFLDSEDSSGWEKPEPGRILFLSDESGSSQLYSMASDGSDVRRLTNDSAFPVRYLAFSPDGEKVLMEGASVGGDDPDGPARYGPALYLANADGTDRRLLFEFDSSVPNSASGQRPFVWSPDSERFIFHRLLIPEVAGIVEPLMADHDGSDVHRITQEGGPQRITSWSPDGRFLLGDTYLPDFRDSTGAIAPNGQIFKMDLNGNYVQVWGDGTTEYLSPVWSPDGSRIAFTNSSSAKRMRDDGIILTITQQEIRIMGADGSNAKTLTRNEDGFFDPAAWSPDGKQILVKATDYIETGFGEPNYRDRIVLVQADGSGIRDITPFPEAYNHQPLGWSR